MTPVDAALTIRCPSCKEPAGEPCKASGTVCISRVEATYRASVAARPRLRDVPGLVERMALVLRWAESFVATRDVCLTVLDAIDEHLTAKVPSPAEDARKGSGAACLDCIDREQPHEDCPACGGSGHRPGGAT